MNWRKLGFTQHKPIAPGVYFVRTDGHVPSTPPARLRAGWDVAEIKFWAGSYDNVHDNTERAAHWRIKTLDGLEYAWRPGTWIKGPINPAWLYSCQADGRVF